MFSHSEDGHSVLNSFYGVIFCRAGYSFLIDRCLHKTISNSELS
jgi:hypothetical protein